MYFLMFLNNYLNKSDKNSLSDGVSVAENGLVCQGSKGHNMLGSWVIRLRGGLGWESGGKLDGQNYGFDRGASKLFNNSTTSPAKIGKCPYFMSNVEASFLRVQKVSCFRTNVIYKGIKGLHPRG
jgi:hypothetical protein